MSKESNKQQIGEEDLATGRFLDLDDDLLDLDNLTLVPDDAKIYHMKIPKYKEIKGYIKGEKLGRGKFGTVREFVHKQTLKRYAGKILQRRIMRRDPHLQRQINKEMGVTYHFEHRNILRVYDIHCSSQKIYLFMEFCWGELEEFLTVYKQLHLCQAKNFFRQICDGLNYLHSRCIIHRDIKPDNVLVDPNLVLKLADFGVCQELSFFTDDDMVGGSDGTPLYHAPEVSDMTIFTYSGSKLDIWAAGVILYQMVTGELPFYKERVYTEEARDHFVNRDPDYPASVREKVALMDLFTGMRKPLEHY